MAGPGLGIERVEKVLGQQPDILAALPQRRHLDREHRQAVEQVLPQAPLRDDLRRVTVGRRDHPHVHADLLGAAHAAEASGLQGP